MGGAGHLNPLLPVLAAAQRLGAEVLLVVPTSMREQVADCGYPSRLGGEPPESEVSLIRERLPTAPPEEAIILGNRELFGRLAARAMMPAVEQAFAAFRPDVVIREPCEYASATVADRLGVPTVQVAISPAEGERASIAAAEPALEELRCGLAERLLAVPYLTRFPASLDPSPFPATFRFREPARRPVPLPDWWPGSSGPLVYLTFGTVFGYLAGATMAYRAAVRAVAGLPVRVLLTVGRQVDPSDLGPLPANVHAEPWVHQADALAAARLVVCHGGSGTVYGALGAGLPLVVVPAFADQRANGRRVSTAGGGLTVERAAGERRLIDDRDAPRITAAIEKVLAQPSYQDVAQRIGADMAATPVIDDLLTDLLAR